MSLTRAINLTYGTGYRFAEIYDEVDDFMIDMATAQTEFWNKPQT